MKHFILTCIACTAFLGLATAQTTINLAERCDCEITRHSSEVTAGDVSPSGETLGDMLIDPSGDLFFWDGDSWEVTGNNDSDWTLNSNDMYNNNSGNIGIGTTSPESKLHITSSSSRVARIESTNPDYSLLEIQDGSGLAAWIGTSGDNGAFNGITSRSFGIRTFNRDIHFGTHEAPNISINAATGRVGIGTSAPEHGFHVNKGINGDYSMKIQNNGGAGYGLWVRANAGTSDPILHLTDNLDRSKFIALGNGNIGIGTTTPTQALSVNGNALVGHTNRVASGANTEDGITLDNKGYIWSSRANGNGVYFAQILGTTGTLHQFYVNSSVVGTITTNGSSTSYNTTSDYRLKQNISPLKGALEEIEKIKPAYYQFKATPEITEAGFLAHELQEIYPQAVTGSKDEVDENGKAVYQNVDYGKLTPLLTAGIQELQQQIEMLRAELEKVSADKTVLESKVELLHKAFEKQKPETDKKELVYLNGITPRNIK